jgi:hypothetical protein
MSWAWEKRASGIDASRASSARAPEISITRNSSLQLGSGFENTKTQSPPHSTPTFTYVDHHQLTPLLPQK